MKKVTLTLAALAAALLLSACGGGGSSDPAPTTPTVTLADYAGVWTGSATGAGGTAQATALIRPDGKAWLLGVNQATNVISFSVGTASYSAGSINLASTSYANITGSAPTPVEGKLTGAAKGTLVGTGRAVGTSSDAAVSIGFDATASAKTMSLADAVGSYNGYLAGNNGTAQFTTFIVTADGSITATLDGGCKTTGKLTVNGPALDVAFTTDAATCNGARSNTGIAVFDGKGTGLVAVVSADKLSGAVVALTKK